MGRITMGCAMPHYPMGLGGSSFLRQYTSVEFIVVVISVLIALAIIAYATWLLLSRLKKGDPNIEVLESGLSTFLRQCGGSEQNHDLTSSKFYILSFQVSQ